jgi:hypothetical protein
MKKILFTAVVLFSFCRLYSQPVFSCDSSGRGSVTLVAPEKLNELVNPPVVVSPDDDSKKDDEPTLQGFRVQVYSGTNRAEANAIKARMLQLYPDIPVYFTYESPNFKVRLGDFRGRIDAQKVFHDLKDSYSGVIVVPDKINFPSLAK